ncbi:hypothetical protein A0H81_14934 [Grifola frondosa]|uniref:Stalled ribosome sensor GCN1-like HEAT repeats region domain-containing protein n=1 Tax=Grifola frondosa TaxID=5627 RepID=A0A1C7LJW7_GRIFR|nr:hypothetical protein A0H81_14934 [Grifola frondosa]
MTTRNSKLPLTKRYVHCWLQICDPEGLNTLMLLLLGWCKHDTVKRRVSACNLFAIFCEETELDSSLYRVDWIRQLISLLDDGEAPVHTAAWHALDAFVKSIPKDELEPLVVPLRRTIESTGAPGIHVPGFSLRKGVSPTVPIIIAGLTTGSNEQREQAAYAISDLVERTEENAIKPFVVPFTGPLIRVATQATTYPPAVKTAILTALSTMLERIPTFVKPFFPQLQRTFVKSASDPASTVVRTKAAQALGVLMRSQTRVDPVITELISGVKVNDDAIAGSLILALAHVVESAGASVGEKAREGCAELVADSFKEIHDDYYIQSVAALFVALSSYPDLVEPIVESLLDDRITAIFSSCQHSCLWRYVVHAVGARSTERTANTILDITGSGITVCRLVLGVWQGITGASGVAMVAPIMLGYHFTVKAPNLNTAVGKRTDCARH